MNAVCRAAAVLAMIFVAVAAQAAALRIYFIDVEGGQATLLVGPTGQSLLIDAGWPGFNGRDAGRITEAAHAAGISRIDYLLITHYHDDHVGGVPELAERMKIGSFIDHGVNREDSNDARANYAAYEKVVKDSKRMTVKPGDRIPLEGVEVDVVSSDGSLITKPLAGAGQPNPLCASEPASPENKTENARSVGVMIRLGTLRILDLGDLTKQKELGLVCPENLLGRVDLLIVSHHGSDQSNSRGLIHAVQPRVAFMDNGSRKGGSPDTWDIVHQSPGLVDLWQLHFAIEGGKDHNVDANFIANPEEKCEGKRIDVVASEDGTISVTNARNGFTKSYKR